MKPLIYLLGLILILVRCSPSSEEEKDQKDEEPSLNYRVDSTGFDLPLKNVTAQYPMTGTKNFRTPSIGSLVQGKIYRSDALHKLTEKDVAFLDGLGIRSIVDLRSAEEIEVNPDRKIPSVVNRFHFPVGRDKKKVENLPDTTYKKIRTMFLDGQLKEVEAYIKSIGLDLSEERKTRYKSFATNHRTSFGMFLKALTDSSNFPLVYHCQGGKDRAGFASAILGKTLGASNEEIMQDYLTTNVYGYETLKKMKDLSPEMKIIVGAHADQIQASFEAIDEEYGSFGNYLKEGLGLTEGDVEEIRKNLLIPHN
ncbi:MAG: tyrosine-protein phosphatase [Bacteroidota bacterium]